VVGRGEGGIGPGGGMSFEGGPGGISVVLWLGRGGLVRDKGAGVGSQEEGRGM